MSTNLASILAGPMVELIDNVFTSDEERADAKLKLLSMEMQPYLSQLEVNKQEAGHSSLFVAGWRPFIGWACGVIFAFNYIGAPMLQWITTMFNADIPSIPVLSLESILPVLLGLLGLGGMRTFEKYTNVEGNR